MQRLRQKLVHDKKGMLRESGQVKRIISQIPEAARETFREHVYNPDKRLGVENVHDEAEYEEEGWEDGGELSSSGKRLGSTIVPPEAKKAPQPSPTSPS